MEKCSIDKCQYEALKDSFCSGHYPTLHGHPLRTTWIGMRGRCRDKHNEHYGARGIVVCDRWLGKDGFKNFLDDVGPKPTRKHSIDRINNDGNYEPSNVRWATRREQMINSRRKHTKVTGVHANPGSKLYPWVATLSVDGEMVLYKAFATEAEAVVARREAEEKYCIL
jgi:hypothetical protein